MVNNKSLRDYSDAELIEELSRRQNQREKNEKPNKWCEDCKHFLFWEGKGEVPDDYNPCEKKHKMNFMLPSYHEDDDFGFYRRVCSDREERNEQ